MAGLVVAAFALRARLVHAPPHGDEAVHFAMARSLGFLGSGAQWLGPGEFYWVEPGQDLHLYPLVLGRPLFAILHYPAAMLGFEAFRWFAVAVASFLPLAVYMLARACGARPRFAASAAVVAAVHPTLVVWGARVFPDTAMAVLALAGLAAWLHGRPRLGLSMLVAACLVKETALPVLVVMALAATWRAARRGGGPAWLAPRVNRPARLASHAWACVALGALGLLGAYLAFPRLPGWGPGGDPAAVPDTLLLSAWLVAPVVAGLWLTRARLPTLVVLALLGFYLVHAMLRDAQVNEWYAILPASLAIAVTATVLDAGMQSSSWPRLAASLGSTAAAFLMAASLVGLGGPLAAALHPGNPREEPGLAQSLGDVPAQDRVLAAAQRFHAAEGPASVLQIDLAWFWVAYPFAGHDRTAFSFTVGQDPATVPLATLVGAAEASDLTWRQDWDTAFNRAFEETYADCKVFEAEFLSAYRVQDCKGRLNDLAAAIESEGPQA